MKLPLKHIIILVICSLTGIFVYQVYWLTGLYQTMKQELENNVKDAMRTSDFNEIVLRVNDLQKDNLEHGEISISAGYGADGNTLVKSQTITYKDSTSMDTLQYRTETEVKKDTINSEPESAVVANEGLDMLLKKQDSLNDLVVYMQRGMHAGVDAYTDIDLQRYDSLLTDVLDLQGIRMPHRVLLIRSASSTGTDTIYADTLDIAGDSTYIPTPQAVCHKYEYDMHGSYSYHLIMEPTDSLIWKQMSGILITSFVIILILAFTFWYLIHTLLKQKTLDEMRSDFTNNITHELKTPIAVAYAANDALLNFKQAEEKEKRDQYLRISQEQLQRLSGLVEQILSMSMERRKTFRLHPEEIKINELIHSLEEQHLLKADKPVCFKKEIVPESLTVVADRNHLNNIISNLIDNAVKYSEKEADITISCQRAENKVTISITDRGIGIPTDKQDQIFEKFYRIPTGNLHAVKGYGLGLYYVKTMTEKHGGSISVTSELGKGSTFTITI